MHWTVKMFGLRETLNSRESPVATFSRKCIVSQGNQFVDPFCRTRRSLTGFERMLASTLEEHNSRFLDADAEQLGVGAQTREVYAGD